jgi:hypothetical protein
VSQTGPSGDHRNAASPQPLTRSRLLVAALGLLVLVGVLTVPGFAGAQGGGDPSEIGKFEAAFEASDEFEFDRQARFGPSKPPFGSDSSKCVLVPPDEQDQKQRDADPDRDGFLACKVAANSTNVAPNGDFVYWNNLEATENVKGTIVSEYGVTSINDQSRVLSNIGDEKKRKWSKPSPVDGGANPNGNMESDPLIPGAESGEPGNDGGFFCADHNWLPDGRLLVTGGTEYSSDPGPPPEGAPGGDEMKRALDGLSINQIVDKVLKDLPGSTTVKDVAESVPGSDTSVGDLVDSLGLPVGSDDSSDSSSEDGGDVKLRDLTDDQLKEIAKKIDDKQLEDIVEGLSDGERAGLLGSPSASGPASQQPGPDGSLEGIGKGFIGATELEGIKNSRIYDPETKKWTQTGSMSEGRWYPAITTLANGDQFVVTGLRKLIRGIYTPGDDEFGDPDEQGGNNEETETFDSDTGEWSLNGPRESEDPSDKELPLFARMHLLPNGHVYYSGGGQAFNPLGQDINEAEWNMLATYDPEKKDWTTLGVPGFDDTPNGVPMRDFGFRGSTFSVQMPLKPDADGEYNVAEHLTAGGLSAAVLPSPGTYFPVKSSRITKVDTSGGTPTTQTRETGPLNQGGEKDTGRWYSSGTLLPTGEVLASSGGDADEVAFPGSEASIKTMELFDPETETWKNVATAAKNRTYHNTATLLPDGRVVIGGLATISTGYGRNAGIPQPESPAQQEDPNAPDPNNPPRSGGQVTAAQDNDGQVTNVQGHDPTMEIYSPPSLFRGPRPSIAGDVACNQDYDDDLKLRLDIPASQVDSVVAMRNASFDHITDADQKSVVLPIKNRSGSEITVETPPSGEVAPPGPYLLFVNKKTSDGPTPSKQAEQIFFGGEGSCGRDDDNDKSNDNTPDGFEFGPADVTSKCLAQGLKLTSQGVGGLQLGMTRAQMILSSGKPANSAARAFRYCINGGGRTYVAFGGGENQAQQRLAGQAQTRGGGRAQFVVSVFGPTGPKGLTRGNSSASARRAYRRAETVGRNHKNLVAPLPGGRGAIVIGFAKGKIRYVGVANRRIAGNLRLLRYYLRAVRLQ